MKNIKRITAIFVITVLLSCMVFPFFVSASIYNLNIQNNSNHNYSLYYSINGVSMQIVFTDKSDTNFTYNFDSNRYYIIKCDYALGYYANGEYVQINTRTDNNYFTGPSYSTMIPYNAEYIFIYRYQSVGNNKYTHFYFETLGYTLTFDSQGGSSISPESGVTDVNLGDSTGYYPQYTPTKDGWNFVGWSLTQNGSIIKDLTLTADTTLYAIWSTNYTSITINKDIYTSPINTVYPFSSSWLVSTNNSGGYNQTFTFDEVIANNNYILFENHNVGDSYYVIMFYDYNLSSPQLRKSGSDNSDVVITGHGDKIRINRSRNAEQIVGYCYFIDNGEPTTLYAYSSYQYLPASMLGFYATMNFVGLYEDTGWLLFNGSADITYVDSNDYFTFYGNAAHDVSAPSVYIPGSPVDLDIYVDISDLPSQYRLLYLEVTYRLPIGINTITVYTDNVNYHFKIPQLYSLGMTITPVYSRVESIQYVFNPNIVDQYFIEELAPDTAFVGSELTFTFAYRYPVNLKQVFYIADNDSTNTKVNISIRSQLYEVGEIEEASEYPVIVFSGTFVMPDDSIKIFLSWEIIGGGTPRGPIIIWDESTGEYSWTEWYDGMVSDIGDINIEDIVSQIPGVFNGILDPLYNLRGLMTLIIVLVVVGFAAWIIRLR